MVSAHKTSLTPLNALFIEVPVPSHERERSCICVLWVSNLLHSTNCFFSIMAVGITVTVWCFCVSFYYKDI